MKRSRSGTSGSAAGGYLLKFLIGNFMTTHELGTIVRKTRLDQGLLQAQLAGAAGVGLRFLVELERGKPTAHLGKVLAVLDALGCRIAISPPHGGRSESR
jgi:y4mF family transcriptional regulator